MQFVIDHQNILICLGCARIPPSLEPEHEGGDIRAGAGAR